MKYKFEYIKNCNMCNSDDFRIMGQRLNKSQGINPKKNLEFPHQFLNVMIAI